MFVRLARSCGLWTLDFGLWTLDFNLTADEPRRAQKNPVASSPVSRFGSEGPSLDFRFVPASVRAGVVELVDALAKIRRCTVARRFARGARRGYDAHLLEPPAPGAKCHTRLSDHCVH